MNRFIRISSALFLSILFLSSAFFCFAEDSKVVRVGFAVQDGLTEKDKHGNYTGYTIDYLNEIKKYTNWEYEYVEVEGSLDEQLTTLLQMLQNGEIDLLGAMNYNEALAQMYDYPAYHYGLAYTVLAVKKDNSRWLDDDFQHWNGITVGVCASLAKRIANFEEFARVNGFTYELVTFDTVDEMIQAVKDGVVDATLSVDISMDPDFRAITRFSPTQYYFATTKGNADIVRALNSALSNIDDSNPYLQTSLYDKYFATENQFFLSDANKEYVQSLGTVRTLILDGNAPVQTNQNAGPTGITISYLKALKKATGLNYELVVAKNYEEFTKILEDPDSAIDLIAGIPSDSSFIGKENIISSLPYLKSSMCLVYNVDYDSNFKLSENLSGNTADTLNFINKHKNSAAYLDSRCVNLYLQHRELYKNITINYNTSDFIHYVFASANSRTVDLMPIINSYLNSLDADFQQQIIYENSLTDLEYTLPQKFTIYFTQIIIVLLIAVVLLSLIITLNFRSRTSMLKKIAQEHERFRQLSNLVDECIFEYNYSTDFLCIQNNKFLFEQQHEIEHYLSTDRYKFLSDLILSKQDGSCDFFADAPENSWYRLIFKVICDENGEPSYALGRIYNIDDEVAKTKALQERAEKDPLTKLYNRATAEEYIVQHLRKTPPQGTLLLFDLDNFKAVNDTMGHQAGDKLLQHLGTFLDYFFRKSDIKCRLGGDEFMVFMDSTIPKEILIEKLEMMLSQANDYIFKTYRHLNLSMSIGAAYVSEETQTFHALYQKADHAMYVAKLSGKNGYFISDCTNCMRDECAYCKKSCKRREYLKSKQRLEHQQDSR